MAEYSLDQLTRAYKEANSELLSNVLRQPGAGAAAASVPSGGGSSWNPLTAAADQAATAVKKLGENSNYTAGVVDALGKFASKIPGVGDAMSKVTTVVGEAAIEGANNIKKNMATGNLSQDIGLLAQNVSGSRMTMTEWNDTVRRGSDVMTSLGSTVTRGTQGFATISKELAESPIGQTLRQAGWGAKEFNDILLVAAKNTKNLNVADASSRQQLINSAGELALKIQEVSAVTGQDKSAILEKLEAEKKDAQLVVARQSMEPAQRAAFDSFRTSLQKLGPEALELGKAFATGGVRTKEQQAIFSAMGTLGPELQRVQKMQMEAAKDPSKKAAADEAQRNFEARYYQYLQSPAVRQRVNFDTSAAGDALRRMVVSGQEGVAAVQAGKTETPGATTADVIARQKRETALATQGRAPTGEAVPGAQTFRTIQAGENALKDLAAGAGIKTKEFNDKINETTGLFTRLNTALKDVLAPRTAEQSAKVIEKPGQVVGEAAKKLVPEGKAGTATALPPEYKGAGSRWSGSLGSVGKLLEDFGAGTPMMLHGKEGVITEKQLQDVVTTVRSSSDKDAAAATIQSAKQIIDSIGERMSGDMKEKNFNVKDMVESTKQLSMQAKQSSSASVQQPVFDMPKTPAANTAVITDQFKGIFSQIGQMQNSVTSKIAENKSTTPTMSNLENLITKLSPVTKESKADLAERQRSTNTESVPAMSEITKELQGLNMRVERLIAEVSNGASMQVKATKGLSGNRIAS